MKLNNLSNNEKEIKNLIQNYNLKSPKFVLETDLLSQESNFKNRLSDKRLKQLKQFNNSEFNSKNFEKVQVNDIGDHAEPNLETEISNPEEINNINITLSDTLMLDDTLVNKG